MPRVDLKEVQAELEEAYKVRSEVDAEASGRAEPPVVPPATPPAPAPTPGVEPPSSAPKAGEPSTPPEPSKAPEQPPAQPPVDWEKKARDAERRFKAIQSAITPAQQENARLRKENEALMERLKTLQPPEDLEAALARAREVLPEAVAPLENALARVEKLETDRTAQAEAHSDRIRREVMGAIFKDHADAGQIAEKEPAFWEFVDNHGPQMAPLLRKILDTPWEYTNEEGKVVGHEVVSDLFTAYKETKAPPPSTPRPSDVAVPAAGTPAPVDGPKGSTSPQVLDQRAMDRLERRIRGGSPEDNRKIQAEILAALEGSMASRR